MEVLHDLKYYLYHNYTLTLINLISNFVEVRFESSA